MGWQFFRNEIEKNPPSNIVRVDRGGGDIGRGSMKRYCVCLGVSLNGPGSRGLCGCVGEWVWCKLALGVHIRLGNWASQCCSMYEITFPFSKKLSCLHNRDKILLLLECSIDHMTLVSSSTKKDWPVSEFLFGWDIESVLVSVWPVKSC